MMQLSLTPNQIAGLSPEHLAVVAELSGKTVEVLLSDAQASFEKEKFDAQRQFLLKSTEPIRAAISEALEPFMADISMDKVRVVIAVASNGTQFDITRFSVDIKLAPVTTGTTVLTGKENGGTVVHEDRLVGTNDEIKRRMNAQGVAPLTWNADEAQMLRAAIGKHPDGKGQAKGLNPSELALLFNTLYPE